MLHAKLHKDDEVWDELVQSIESSSIFISSAFLKPLSSVRIAIHKGEEVRALFVCTGDKKNENILLSPTLVYSGLYFKQNSNRRSSDIVSEQYAITDCLLKFLTSNFQGIAFQTSLEMTDVRPFNWFNHGTEKTGKFEVAIRYTSILDITDCFYKLPKEKMSLFLNMDIQRQKDIRKAEKSGLELIAGDLSSVSTIIGDYMDTLFSEKVGVDRNYVNEIENIIKSCMCANFGKLYHVYSADHGITYSIFMSTFKGRAVYLYGAGNKKLMGRGDAVFGLWKSFEELSKLGIHTVDLEGVNSPNRGSFKTSLGGKLTPYFRIES